MKYDWALFIRRFTEGQPENGWGYSRLIDEFYIKRDETKLQFTIGEIDSRYTVAPPDSVVRFVNIEIEYSGVKFIFIKAHGRGVIFIRDEYDSGQSVVIHPPFSKLKIFDINLTSVEHDGSVDIDEVIMRMFMEYA